MAKYRPILCAIWDDPDFQDYSPDAKLLFLYLCTNRRTTESGIYPITIKTIQNETCIKKETIKKLLTNGLKNVSYDFDNSFVFVHRFMNYNSGGRPERIELGIKSDNQNYQTPLWKIFIEQYPHLKSGFETKNLTTYNTNYNTNTITNTKEPLQNGCETVTKPLKKINKTKYLECVFLNDREKQRLEEIHGTQITKQAIEILNNYKMASGKKYKSDYHAILNWVIDKVKGGTNEPNKRHWEPQKNWKEMEIDRAAAEANRLFAEGSKTKEGTHPS